MTTNTTTGSAHGKINLGLEILRKRPDGYHEIATVFCPIALTDHIRCTRTTEEISLTIEGIELPVDASNLCVRAAELLLPFAKTPSGVRMELKKRIPVGAGLGGGSSDAARVLMLLNELWETERSVDDLKVLALELGADVPYFIDGGLALASGIGEKLQPLGTRFPFWIVVVVPPEQISTAWAYAHVTPRNTDISDLLDAFPERANDLAALDDLLTNDFEEVALAAHPVIRTTMEALTSHGLSCVRMSGSGSAVFGLTASEPTARAAASAFSSPFVVSLTPPVLQ